MVGIQLNDICRHPKYLSLCPRSKNRKTGSPQSNAKYIHRHRRSFPNNRTLDIHLQEAAIPFPTLRFQYIHLLDGLGQQWPTMSEHHLVRQYVILLQCAREFQLSSHLLAKCISKSSYSLSALTSSIAAAASSIAAKALSI